MTGRLLTSEDYAAVVRALEHASAGADLAEFGQRVCEALDMLFPAVSVSYNELDLASGQAAAVVLPHPGEAWFARYQPVFERHMAQNPLVTAALAAGGDLAPADWLDADPERGFERSALFREFYAPNGIRSQLVFTVPSAPGIMVALAVNRDGSGFDLRERELAAVLRPVLGNAYRLVRRLSRADLLGPPEPPVVVAGPAGRLGLTRREAEIAELVATGATNQQIAAVAGISPGTVRKHLENVYRKLGVTNRVAVAARVLAAGLFDAPR